MKHYNTEQSIKTYHDIKEGKPIRQVDKGYRNESKYTWLKKAPVEVWIVVGVIILKIFWQLFGS